MDRNKSKNKKKTLTISSSFGKKLDSSSYKQTGKKSFLIEASWKSSGNIVNLLKISIQKETRKEILLENLSKNRQQKDLYTLKKKNF